MIKYDDFTWLDDFPDNSHKDKEAWIKELKDFIPFIYLYYSEFISKEQYTEKLHEAYLKQPITDDFFFKLELVSEDEESTVDCLIGYLVRNNLIDILDGSVCIAILKKIKPLWGKMSYSDFGRCFRTLIHELPDHLQSSPPLNIWFKAEDIDLFHHFEQDQIEEILSSVT